MTDTKTTEAEKDLKRYRELKRKPWMRSLWSAGCLFIMFAIPASQGIGVTVIFLIPIYPILKNRYDWKRVRPIGEQAQRAAEAAAKAAKFADYQRQKAQRGYGKTA
jgi:hypothetical protein